MAWFLALDIETGGIGLPCSLLTAHFAVCDPQLQVVSNLDLAIKPDDGVYHLTAEGMAVNKINIVEHNAKAITLKQAGTTLYNFLSSQHSGFLWENPKTRADKFIPIGHGVRQDIEFMIASKLISRGSWETYVSHRVLDTHSIANFLKLLGKLPEDLSGSLTGLMEHYNIEFAGEAHEAAADAVAGVDILRKFLGEFNVSQ